MSRRVLTVLSVVCVAALSVTAVALAHGGGDKPKTAHAKQQKAGAPGRFLGGGLFGVALDRLAGRLDVAPADLRTAVEAVAREQFDKKLQAAGLTPGESAAVTACRAHGVKQRDAARVRTTATGAACDPALLKSAAAKLEAQPKPDLAALKTELATSLAAKIGKTPDEVVAAVRAELDARLTQAVAAGWLTQKGHDLALACFDDPASCDLKALRAEVTLFGHKQRHHGDGGAGSGQMHPGGRATSTPLR
jgi:hypothetical protein